MAQNNKHNKIIAPILKRFRRCVAAIGYYSLKKKIKRYFFISKLKKEDKAKKKEIDKLILAMPDNLLKHDISENDIILSLTSYGKRVTDTLPYALYSMLTQSLCPAKIVVYLDNDNWNDEKLPFILQKLRRIGVEFYYCEDIKSYKKLIPALRMFPNNPIITLDDDFYYNKHFTEWMTSAYNASDKKTILGQWGCVPQKKDGTYLPYNSWPDCIYNVKDEEISFYGCCCCCYPPHIFDEEILKEEIFMQLCPTADDIWFWAMEERQKIKRAYIKPAGYGYNVYVNRCEEYWVDVDNTLMAQNVTNGKNNTQFRAVVDYYHLEDSL